MATSRGEWEVGTDISVLMGDPLLKGLCCTDNFAKKCHENFANRQRLSTLYRRMNQKPGVGNFRELARAGLVGCF